MEHPIDFKFSGSNVKLLKNYKMIPSFSDDEQTVRNYVVFFFLTSLKKSDIFWTAPGTDDNVAMTTCIFGFYSHFSFFFLSTI